jgi:hypothetical protein
MATLLWQPIQYCYCHHVQHTVTLEAELVYPAEWLPDQAPHVRAHRCSCGTECNQDDRPSCIWAGTNPNLDPFLGL